MKYPAGFFQQRPLILFPESFDLRLEEMSGQLKSKEPSGVFLQGCGTGLRLLPIIRRCISGFFQPLLLLRQFRQSVPDALKHRLLLLLFIFELGLSLRKCVSIFRANLGKELVHRWAARQATQRVAKRRNLRQRLIP